MQLNPTRRLIVTVTQIAAMALVAVAQNGEVAGRVLDDADKPASGIVTLTPRSRGDSGKLLPSFNSPTDGNGRFQFGSVPPGEYEICVQADDRELLNPCVWADYAIPVTIVADRIAPQQTIQLERGYRVKVRIDDTAKTLQNSESKFIGGQVISGVASSRFQYLVGATERDRDANGRNMEVIVPFEKDLDFLAFSGGLELADDKGKAVDKDAGLKAKIRVPKGGSIPEIQVKVTKVKTDAKPIKN